ncbi:MAG: hypothetical protein K2X27_25730 [Candidatus Obscuribacterales bacterium]|nr:hypothetical protein [Candidatus Obscuribacterales bacterium]
MKCFTLKAKKDVIFTPSLHRPMTHVAPELYPQPSVGFRALPGQSEIEIAPGLKAALSSDLLAQCKPDTDGSGALVIERASLERSANGSLTLVPEKPGVDQDKALVILDLGRGEYASVRYEVGNRVVLRARRHSDALFGSEELALVEVPVGRPFSAYRSSRRWYCFGADVVGEQLQIRFDGKQLSCEPAR